MSGPVHHEPQQHVHHPPECGAQEVQRLQGGCSGKIGLWTIHCWLGYCRAVNPQHLVVLTFHFDADLHTVGTGLDCQQQEGLKFVGVLKNTKIAVATNSEA